MSFEDKLKYARWEHQVRLMERANQFMEELRTFELPERVSMMGKDALHRQKLWGADSPPFVCLFHLQESQKFFFAH